MRTTISTLPGSITPGPSTPTSASAPIRTSSIGNKPLLFKIIRLWKFCVCRVTFAKWASRRSRPLRIRTRLPLQKPSRTLRRWRQLLFFSAGVTKSRKHAQGETFFRAAACTGALYEIELYVVCTDLRSKESPSSETPAVAAGVYHFGAAEFGLRQLRSGDFRKVILDATANDPAVARAPVVIICTGTYWRNAWKYRSRTYRHFGWDNGTILAIYSRILPLPQFLRRSLPDLSTRNLTIFLGWTRSARSRFYSSVRKHSSTPPASPSITKLELPIVAYSEHEIDFPAMRKIHEASSLDSDQEVAEWRGKTPAIALRSLKGEVTALKPDESKAPQDPIEQVISRRGSTRQFSRDPLTFPQLSMILDRSTRGIAADFLEPYGSHLDDLYLIVNNVVGLQAGAYFYRWQEKRLELLKAGDFRDKAGYLGLEQQIPADAAVDVFFLADLKKILGRFGNRGYRATQLEAGVLGGKLYLTAYAQHLGASGLTFYDDDVVSFFSPHAKGKSAIFLVALGRSAVRK